MTVKELIKLLKEYPEDRKVVVNGYEGGWIDIEKRSILKVEVALNYNTEDYYGAHAGIDSVLDKEMLQSYKVKKVIAIHR